MLQPAATIAGVIHLVQMSHSEG